MVRRLEVLGRVLVFRRIAATYVSAGQTEPQVDPGVPQLHTLFADVLVGGSDFDLISMFAVHFSLTSFWLTLSRGFAYFQCVAVPTGKPGAGFVGAL